jgi:hypothetical protein
VWEDSSACFAMAVMPLKEQERAALANIMMTQEKLITASKWFEDLSAFADLARAYSGASTEVNGEHSRGACPLHHDSCLGYTNTGCVAADNRPLSRKNSCTEDEALTRRCLYCNWTQKHGDIDWDACDPVELASADRRARKDYAYKRPMMTADEIATLKNKWRLKQFRKYSPAASVFGPRETQKDVFKDIIDGYDVDPTPTEDFPATTTAITTVRKEAARSAPVHSSPCDSWLSDQDKSKASLGMKKKAWKFSSFFRRSSVSLVDET